MVQHMQFVFRYRHEIAYYENRIFVLGGGTSQRVYSLDVIYVYCIENNKWFLKNAKPDLRCKGINQTNFFFKLFVLNLYNLKVAEGAYAKYEAILRLFVNFLCELEKNSA